MVEGADNWVDNADTRPFFIFCTGFSHRGYVRNRSYESEESLLLCCERAAVCVVRFCFTFNRAFRIQHTQ